jgi:hypothetical protein
VRPLQASPGPGYSREAKESPCSIARHF